MPAVRKSDGKFAGEFQFADFFAQVFGGGGNDGHEHCFAHAPLHGAAHQVAFCAGVQGGGLGGITYPPCVETEVV